MRKTVFSLGFSLILLGAQANAQTTLPLSQSSTFQAKANLLSPAFTGTPTAPTPPTGNNSTRIATTAFISNLLANPVTFQSNLVINAASTPNFYTGFSSGPYINFAPNTLLLWNLSTARYEFYSQNLSVPKLYIGTDVTSNVPFYAQTSIAVKGGATNFYLGLNGNRPFVAFDGSASRIEFDGTGNYVWYVGGNKIARLDPNGNLYIRGSITQNLGASCC